MPLTPEARAIVDAASAAFPELGTAVLDAAEARRLLAARPAPVLEPIPVAQVRQRRIPGPPGAPEVGVRIYRPAAAAGRAPIVIFCHGGGFVLCGLDSHDRFCRAIAVGAGAIVVSVDYRQAPNTGFPPRPRTPTPRCAGSPTMPSRWVAIPPASSWPGTARAAISRPSWR